MAVLSSRARKVPDGPESSSRRPCGPFKPKIRTLESYVSLTQDANRQNKTPILRDYAGKQRP